MLAAALDAAPCAKALALVSIKTAAIAKVRIMTSFWKMDTCAPEQNGLAFTRGFRESRSASVRLDDLSSHQSGHDFPPLSKTRPSTGNCPLAVQPLIAVRGPVTLNA